MFTWNILTYALQLETIFPKVLWTNAVVVNKT